MPVHKLLIRDKKTKQQKSYSNITAADKLEAYTWGERQAKALGYENPVVELVDKD